MNSASSHFTSWGASMVSNSDMSEAYAAIEACSSGSSGSLPSARIHRRW